MVVILKLKLEQFLFEYQKVIGFALLSYNIGIKNSCHFFMHVSSETKPNCDLFPHILLHFMSAPRDTLSFDWFTVLSVSFVSG